MAKSLDAWLLNELRNELLSDSHRSGHPAFSAARAVIEREPDRADLWRLEKIAAIAQREFDKLSRPARSYQEFLPGMDVAELLPQRKGSVPLGEATLRQLRESVAALKKLANERAAKRSDRKVSRLKRLIIEMSPYAKAQHGLTVNEYIEIRKAGMEIGTKARAAK